MSKCSIFFPILVSLAILLICKLDQGEAVPLSRYGRANLARYGKRSGGAEQRVEYLVDSGNTKGICTYTGVGELYWCQFLSMPVVKYVDEEK